MIETCSEVHVRNDAYSLKNKEKKRKKRKPTQASGSQKTRLHSKPVKMCCILRSAKISWERAQAGELPKNGADFSISKSVISSWTLSEC